MISFHSTKALASITLAACAAVASPADGQTTLGKTSLGLPGWGLHQQGDLFADDPTTRQSVGCLIRRNCEILNRLRLRILYRCGLAAQCAAQRWGGADLVFYRGQDSCSKAVYGSELEQRVCRAWLGRTGRRYAQPRAGAARKLGWGISHFRMRRDGNDSF